MQHNAEVGLFTIPSIIMKGYKDTGYSGIVHHRSLVDCIRASEEINCPK
jgi:hypothetical protein